MCHARRYTYPRARINNPANRGRFMFDWAMCVFVRATSKQKKKKERNRGEREQPATIVPVARWEGVNEDIGDERAK